MKRNESVEDYLETILMLRERNGLVRSIDIARQLDYSKPSISRAMGLLIFREMMKPIFKMIDKAEDMDELQKVLKDEKKLRELYQDMESPELEDLIQQGIYLSHLIGRSMD